MDIRSETSQDQQAIRKLLIEAFPTAGEADLVEQLRADGDIVHSTVCTIDGELAGHAMTSRLMAPFKAIALAPVATKTTFRKKGVADKLIRSIIKMAEEEGWQGMFVLGNPAYYQRFGFSVSAAAEFTSPYAGPYFMGMALGAPDISGFKRVDNPRKRIQQVGLKTYSIVWSGRFWTPLTCSDQRGLPKVSLCPNPQK